MGKTRFAEEVLGSADVRFLRGTPRSGGARLRAGDQRAARVQRAVPGALSRCGPLRSHLALLLPELGEAVRGERSGHAVRGDPLRAGDGGGRAAGGRAARRPPVVRRRHARAAGALAAPLRELPMLVLGAYRSDEIPRAHPLRRLRNDLRRNRLLCELALEPLTAQGTAELAERVLGARPSARLAGTLHDRTGGNPFFVEELAGALEHGGRLRPGNDGPRAGARRRRAAAADHPRRGAAAGRRPVGASPRDGRGGVGGGYPLRPRARGRRRRRGRPRRAARMWPDRGARARTRRLPAPARARRHLRGRAVAAPACAPPQAGRRPRGPRRRSGRGGRRTGWRRATDPVRSTRWCGRSRSCSAVHAYRDAARLGRQALDLWPEGSAAPSGSRVLERHARFAELAGELAEATRAQREVVAARRSEGAGRALADAERRLAAIYELQGTASGRSPRGASRPTPSPRTASPARRPRSD